ncbi:TKL family protein kinase [Trichomonas vaginalis G3]|uniref:TKL family protein kinase n=2 Tax=Trichomonas vaginalis (strain ATCC PRA-98 / G3) TaxID=412133 RepID=A2DQP3_TRIV3|nr:TKL family protein kinase [Trichomonas vaginalis G3]|eukprot:XP_001329550.1 TKL family protein kinase [Trichomonas vaginalis G3]
MQTWTLSKLISHRDNMGSCCLDIHQIFKPLLDMFLQVGESYDFDPEKIKVDNYNSVVTLPPQLDLKRKRQKYKTFIQLFDSIDQNLYPDFVNLCSKYQTAPTDDLKQQIKEKYKTVFMLESYEAIGYGAHSVVIHSKTITPDLVFKYSKLGNQTENEIKNHIGMETYSPGLQIPSKYFTSSPYYKNGTLTKYLHENPDLTNHELVELIQKISNMIQALHAKKILCRDLKPDNILMDDDFNPVYVDFDVSEYNSLTAYDFTGTPFYMAPEVLRNRFREARYSQCGTESDIFSLGCVINFIFNQNYPYTNLTPLIHPDIRKLILEMTHTDAKKRPSIFDVIAECQKIEESFSKTEKNIEIFGILVPTEMGLKLIDDNKQGIEAESIDAISSQETEAESIDAISSQETEDESIDAISSQETEDESIDAISSQETEDESIDAISSQGIEDESIDAISSQGIEAEFIDTISSQETEDESIDAISSQETEDKSSNNNNTTKSENVSINDVYLKILNIHKKYNSQWPVEISRKINVIISPLGKKIMAIQLFVIDDFDDKRSYSNECLNEVLHDLQALLNQ